MNQLKVLMKQEDVHLLVFISYFTVSVIPSLNTFQFSNDFMVLIISFISSFEINKSCSDSSFSTIFLSNLFIAFEVKFLLNLDKLSRLNVARGAATFVSVFLAQSPNQESKKHLIKLF